MIWFSSDWHAYHKNICKGCTSWTSGSMRDFDDEETMTEKLIENINKYVKESDDLYFLGDLSFGSIDNIWRFRKRINCKTIHFILGNHDNHIKKNKILPNCTFKELYEYYQPWAISDNLKPQPAQDLFFTVQNYLELVIDKKTFVLSHHPFEEWYEMDRGSIHLHGHLHGNLNHSDSNMFFRRMDVGIDWKEFRPYSIDEILDIMKNRQIKKHNS